MTNKIRENTFKWSAIEISRISWMIGSFKLQKRIQTFLPFDKATMEILEAVIAVNYIIRFTSECMGYSQNVEFLQNSKRLFFNKIYVYKDI